MGAGKAVDGGIFRRGCGLWRMPRTAGAPWGRAGLNAIMRPAVMPKMRRPAWKEIPPEKPLLNHQGDGARVGDGLGLGLGL